MLLGWIVVGAVVLMVVGALMQAWYRVDNQMRLNHELRDKRADRSDPTRLKGDGETPA